MPPTNQALPNNAKQLYQVLSTAGIGPILGPQYKHMGSYLVSDLANNQMHNAEHITVSLLREVKLNRERSGACMTADNFQKLTISESELHD